MKSFYHILTNTLVTGVSVNAIWFAAIYWAYLGTRSVLATSIMSGVFLVAAALSSFWLGSIVDHNKKKKAMLISTISTITFFILALTLYGVTQEGALADVGSLRFWLFIILILFGVIAGNIRNIAMSTLVTIMVPEDRRDKTNGLVGTVMGVSFMTASIISGFAIAYAGMFNVLAIGISVLVLVIAHLLVINISEPDIIHTEEKPRRLDIKGTIAATRAVPGLFSLIFFTTFNNFLGGVFMPLLDPYGLSLVSVQVWGALWGVLSVSFIFGGLWIAKKGLGTNPLKTLFRVNIILWIVSMLMTVQPSLILLSVGIFIWLALVPFAEATEQTIIQKVVPLERQGRVFGFAHSIEQAASPITAFLIGPIAQFVFIPFMTTGRGVELIGSWFGVGPGRGIALVFIFAGILGLIVTLIAMRSRSYKLLAERYQA